MSRVIYSESADFWEQYNGENEHYYNGNEKTKCLNIAKWYYDCINNFYSDFDESKDNLDELLKLFDIELNIEEIEESIDWFAFMNIS